MFMQYRREFHPFRSAVLENDPRLRISYPAGDQATILPGQDFYVIGSFHGIDVPENAVLRVIVTSPDGTPVRTVETAIRDNYDGINVNYPGLVTEMSADEVRRSGMPDLVYDPVLPESIRHTWNKAFYTKDHFAALIYGGTFNPEFICRTDQFGAALEPLYEGVYKVSVEIRFSEVSIRSAVSLRIKGGTKEIVLSRYTSEEHSMVLERFAKEKGLELYSGIPYPGIWDSNALGADWPSRLYIEIPDRWEYNDSLEYITDRVYCFDFDIADECVGYRTEIAALLKHDRDSVNDSERVKFFYYKKGLPSPLAPEPAAEQFAEFQKDEYLAITSAKSSLSDPCRVVIHSVLKPIPSAVFQTAPSKYCIENSVKTLHYHVTCGAESIDCDYPTGSDHLSACGKHEWCLLQSSHELRLPEEWKDKTIGIRITALDKEEKVWDEKRLTLQLKRGKPQLIFCDVDGTLIDSSQLITPAFGILRGLITEGKLPFTIATSRSPELIRNYVEYLKIDQPLVVNNGAGIVYEGKLLWNETFPAKLVKEIIHSADKLDMAIFMCIDDQELVYRHNAYIQREIDDYERYNHFYIPLKSEWDTLQFERVMITDPQKPGRVDEILPLLEPYRSMLMIIRYDDRHVDIMKEGISKGWAIRRLSKLMGIHTQDIMVIGDGLNDIEMVREVGMGAAVGNAKQLLKDEADYICSANNTEGVIEALRLFR